MGERAQVAFFTEKKYVYGIFTNLLNKLIACLPFNCTET